MAIDFNKYKKYDTSDGYGDERQWRTAFNSKMNEDEAIEIITSQSKSPIEILGIQAGFSQIDLKKGFRSKIVEWHPDKNPHRLKEAEEMSKKIIAAYTILKNK